MKKNNLNTIDKILLGCALFLTVFTIVMIIIFIIYQQEPATLITSVFGVLGGEAVVSFFIWYIKKKYAKDLADKNQEPEIDNDMEDDGK